LFPSPGDQVPATKSWRAFAMRPLRACPLETKEDSARSIGMRGLLSLLLIGCAFCKAAEIPERLRGAH
jgi:hypothetical protein